MVAKGPDGAEAGSALGSGRSAESVRGRAAGRAVARGGPVAYFRQLALLADGLVLALAFPLAYLVKTRMLPADLTPLYAPEVYIAPAALVAMVTLFALERRGAHTAAETLSLGAITGTVVLSVGMALVFGATVLYTFKLSYVSRLFLAIYGATSTILLIGVHLSLRPLIVRARESGEAAPRVLFVGEADDVAHLSAVLDGESPFGIAVVDRLSVAALQRATVSRESGTEFPALDELLAREAIDEVAVATPDLRAADISRLVAACDREGVHLHVSVEALGAGLERARLEHLADVPLLSINPQVHSAWARAVKRALDFAVAPILLVLSAPLWVLIAAAVSLDSDGPVFFRQERIGLNKRRFGMLKFRTMAADAEGQRGTMSGLNEADGPIFKVRRDPRVTRVGSFLRRFDLDELPQLLNVLAGHMTLIGPRPMIPEEIVDFASWQRKRFSMHPGITGLWQVSHALGDPFLSGLQADLDYIDRWSLKLDLTILLRTFLAVLRNRDAH
ncbi:MAG: sugar transferase [Candidatus Binatia bacterium]|nr:sugar transferase [Candidatus Binatia bacterium]